MCLQGCQKYGLKGTLKGSEVLFECCGWWLIGFDLIFLYFGFMLFAHSSTLAFKQNQVHCSAIGKLVVWIFLKVI